MVSAHGGGHAGASPPGPTGLSDHSLHCRVEQSGRRAAECHAGLHGVTSQRARGPVSHNPDEFCALGGNYLI